MTAPSVCATVLGHKWKSIIGKTFLIRAKKTMTHKLFKIFV